MVPTKTASGRKDQEEGLYHYVLPRGPQDPGSRKRWSLLGKFHSDKSNLAEGRWRSCWRKPGSWSLEGHKGACSGAVGELRDEAGVLSLPHELRAPSRTGMKTGSQSHCGAMCPWVEGLSGGQARGEQHSTWEARGRQTPPDHATITKSTTLSFSQGCRRAWAHPSFCPGFCQSIFGLSLSVRPIVHPSNHLGIHRLPSLHPSMLPSIDPSSLDPTSLSSFLPSAHPSTDCPSTHTQVGGTGTPEIQARKGDVSWSI